MNRKPTKSVSGTNAKEESVAAPSPANDVSRLLSADEQDVLLLAKKQAEILTLKGDGSFIGAGAIIAKRNAATAQQGSHGN